MNLYISYGLLLESHSEAYKATIAYSTDVFWIIS